MSEQRSLGMELSKVLFREEPTLLDNDLEANARACAAISNLLGCLLAAPLVKQGDRVYFKALEMVMRQIHDSAMSTALKAEAAATETPHGPAGHA